MGLQIKKTSSYLPNNIISNEYFEKYLDTNDEWISTRTGIKTRHFLKNENTSDMVVKVCEKLDISDIDIDKIKVVLVSTLSSDYMMPSLASLAQRTLNLKNNIFVADINMACSGFVGGIKILDSMLDIGEYGIIICAEHLSKITNMQDRSTAVLFGDGAGGVLVQKNDDVSAYDFGAKYSDALSLKNCDDEYIQMNGKEVYRFAVETLATSIEKVLEKLGKTADEIDFFVSHQANEKIINSACKHLKISTDKFPTNLKNVGNTSSASIPLLLDEMNKKGLLKTGSKIILCGFGGGLSWVSYYISF